MSRKNKRGSQKPRVNKSYALIVEGETEFWYINKIKEQEKDKRLDLQPELPQKKNLEEICKSIKKLEGEGYEKIFWIIDLDTIIKEAKEATKKEETKLSKLRMYYNDLKNENVIIIINNPCLEYWFLQHYTRTAKYFRSYKDVEKELKKNKDIKDYEKTQTFYKKCNGGKGIYSLLKPNLKTAIDNSKELKKIDFSKSDINEYEISHSSSSLRWFLFQFQLCV